MHVLPKSLLGKLFVSIRAEQPMTSGSD